MPPITDNTAMHRFEMTQDGATAFITYLWHGTVLVLLHTEVPAIFRGKGIGRALVCGVLERLVEAQNVVDIRCAFIRHILHENPALATRLTRVRSS